MIKLPAPHPMLFLSDGTPHGFDLGGVVLVAWAADVDGGRYPMTETPLTAADGGHCPGNATSGDMVLSVSQLGELTFFPLDVFDNPSLAFGGGGYS